MEIKMKVMVAMSGGVDSSVCAAMLHKQGYDVVGVHLKLHGSDAPTTNTKVCCSIDDVIDCRLICENLGIPFYVFNMEDEFKESVIKYFVDSYRNGSTPSPCTMCNGEIKFKLLLKISKQLGCDALATGHYAEIKNDRLYASASKKDQSYFLFNINKNAIKHIMFPLASMSKDETRAIASEMGLINAEKKESMEICFVSNGHHSDFVQSHIPSEVDVSAKLILEDGTHVGEVDRYFRFTVGQRRGLPVSGYYIKDINSESRIITLSNKRVKTGEISLTRTNWYEDTSSISRRIFAKTNHRGQLYEVSISGDTISFYEEVNLPARGQVVVIYDEEGMVVGGGYIK